MIRPAVIARLSGLFLLVLAALMIVPVVATLHVPQAGAAPMLWSILVTAGAGGLLAWLFRHAPADLSRRDGLLLSVLTWVGGSVFAALPFLLSGHFASFADACFEATSGLTTTGATVLPNVEVLQPAVLMWRCLTHWVGGMGIVLLGVAILPLIGHGGVDLYRAEFSGARSRKLRPRIAEASLALWKIYAALTLAQAVALWAAGMTLFDSLCHTFATVGTGGFSTRTASIAAFPSPLVQYILVFFMVLAGTSFVQQYALWVERRPGAFFRDVEVRAFLSAIAVATLLIFGLLYAGGRYELEPAFRSALFHVSSIITTTGFACDDFEVWHPVAQVILLMLMVVGGCTGSTAGGVKMARLLLLGKVVAREFRRMVERHGVFAVRLGGRVVEEPAVQSLLNLVYLAILVNFVSVLFLAAGGADLLTAISAVTACMFNVGPGFGSVGPTDHYGHLPALSKLVLSVAMIAGRLEFYTLIVIFTPAFWRR